MDLGVCGLIVVARSGSGLGRRAVVVGGRFSGPAAGVPVKGPAVYSDVYSPFAKSIKMRV